MCLEYDASATKAGRPDTFKEKNRLCVRVVVRLRTQRCKKCDKYIDNVPPPEWVLEVHICDPSMASTASRSVALLHNVQNLTSNRLKPSKRECKMS